MTKNEKHEKPDSNKKHPCPDCAFCQQCSEDRCRLCLNRKSCRRRLSLAEQIALYDALNSAASARDDDTPE
jgi:hypothetical protein